MNPNYTLNQSVPPCGSGLVLQNTDSVHLFGSGNTCEPLYAEVQVSEVEGNNLMILDDGLYVSGGTGGSGGTGENIYNSDGQLTGLRTLDMNGESLIFDNGGLFRVRSISGTTGGIHDFNEGLDSLIYNEVESYNITSDLLNGVKLIANDLDQSITKFLQVHKSGIFATLDEIDVYDPEEEEYVGADKLVGQLSSNNQLGEISVGSGLTLRNNVLRAEELGSFSIAFFQEESYVADSGFLRNNGQPVSAKLFFILSKSFSTAANSAAYEILFTWNDASNYAVTVTSTGTVGSMEANITFDIDTITDGDGNNVFTLIPSNMVDESYSARGKVIELWRGSPS